MPVEAEPIETDAVVIGAGPVGLFSVFQLGLQGIKTHVVDALPRHGGQCAELYPDKPIYDIPGIKVCTGSELTQKLLEQIAPFNTQFHLGQQVTALRRIVESSTTQQSRFEIRTSSGLHINSRVVVIAAGVGAFLPRRISSLPELEKFEGSQVHFHGLSSQPQPKLENQKIMVVGGDDCAVELALNLLAKNPASITLVHRRDILQISKDKQKLLDSAIERGDIRFVAGQLDSTNEAEGVLKGVGINTPEDKQISLPCDTLFVQLGLSPKLGPVAEWGLDIERKQLKVSTDSFCTSERGIFAIGDINTYPGKRKLIVSGFHEATLAAFAAAEIVFPDQPVHLQYTTTSPKLHALLGVPSPEKN